MCEVSKPVTATAVMPSTPNPIPTRMPMNCSGLHGGTATSTVRRLRDAVLRLDCGAARLPWRLGLRVLRFAESCRFPPRGVRDTPSYPVRARPTPRRFSRPLFDTVDGRELCSSWNNQRTHPRETKQHRWRLGFYRHIDAAAIPTRPHPRAVGGGSERIDEFDRSRSVRETQTTEGVHCHVYRRRCGRSHPHRVATGRRSALSP